MKLKHNTLIFLAGLTWLIIGVFLLSLGIHFILETIRTPLLTQIAGRFSIAFFVEKFTSDRTQAILWILCFSLLVGYLKGKMVLAKSVHRQIKRIDSLQNPAHLKHLYSKGYYLLVALMICLGMVLRFLPITLDTRGAIDMAIGAALINGAVLYFRTLSQRMYISKKQL